MLEVFELADDSLRGANVDSFRLRVLEFSRAREKSDSIMGVVVVGDTKSSSSSSASQAEGGSCSSEYELLVG